MCVQERLLHRIDPCCQRPCFPAIALAGGLVFGFSFVHPFHLDSKQLSKFLLQASVVGLGFGMDLHQVITSVAPDLSIPRPASALPCCSVGVWESLLKVSGNLFLISAGTAICGGSAIAAIAPITNASEEEIAVSLGTVFVLNSVALLTFPPIGTALHMTQTQFGLWSALAIHDTSSVVGATAKFGAVALAVGTTVKLARALWIVPRLHRHRIGQQEQGTNPMALVHSLLLPCRRRQHLRSHLSADLSGAQASRRHRPDRHPLT